MAQKVQPHEAHKVDVVLVNYYPSQVQFIPEPLPPSTELLPWEKRAEKDRQREEARKKQLQSAKKKSILLLINCILQFFFNYFLFSII